MTRSRNHPNGNGAAEIFRCSKVSSGGLLHFAVLVTGLFFALASTTPVDADAVRADAVVLVNSSSAKYLDFQHSIQPYLDNFGVPYTVLDIASNTVGTNLGNYSVIIVGHSQLDTNHAFLNATAQQNILTAVTNGAGLVNFDGDLFAAGTNRYQFIQAIFGFTNATVTAGTNVTFPATQPQGQMHYITSLHQTNSSQTSSTISFRSSMSVVAGITFPTNVTAVALSSGKPFLAVTKFGQGRVVHWTSYGWMTTAVLGPIEGMDDLVWRSVVWSARKPFVMRGLPNFVTMRVDDVTGPLTWTHIANEMGFKPWLGLFWTSIGNSNALTADLSALTRAGNATASVHSFDCCYKFFYWNDTYGNGESGTNWPDSVMASNITAVAQWHTNNGIPISKLIIPHFGEMGVNSFNNLKAWGVEYIGNFILNQTFYSNPPWPIAGPYRLYETPQSNIGPLPVYYADFLTQTNVPGLLPALNGKYFLFITEIRDDSSCGEWCPANGDVAGTIARGTRQLERALNGMVLATLYTHEWYIVPIPQSSNQTPITTNNWRAMLQGITNNLAAYHPTYVTLDYALQYVRATKTSRVVTANYDPVSGQVTATLTGYTDLPTLVDVFTGADNAITNTFGNVPAFASGPVTDLVAGPPSATVTASNLSKAYGQTVVFSGTEFSTSGFQNGDGVSNASLSSAGAGAGAPVNGSPYSIVVTNAVGTGLSNYAISYVSGQLTVGAAPLMVAANNTNRPYGATNPVFTVSYSGFLDGDSASVLSGAPSLITSAATNSPAGSCTITNTIGTLSATNYSFSFTNGTLTINPAGLTVTASDTNRFYGLANPVFTAGYEGFVNGDTASVLSGSPSLTTAATAASLVGTYPIIATNGTLNAASYTFSFVNGTLAVTPAPAPVILAVGLTDQIITVTWSSVAGETYGLQSTTNLINWINVLPNVTATGTTTSQTNFIGNVSQQYYRVSLVPDGP